MGYKVDTKNKQQKVPVGRYLVEIQSCEWVISKKKKTPGMAFKFRILSGDQKNKTFVYTYYLTPKTEWMVATFMDALGFDGAFELDEKNLESMFLGKRFVANVEHSSYEGKTREELSFPELMTSEERDSVAAVPVKTVKGGVFVKKGSRPGGGGGGAPKPTPTPVVTSSAPVNDSLPEDEDFSYNDLEGVGEPETPGEFPDDDIPF